MCPVAMQNTRDNTFFCFAVALNGARRNLITTWCAAIMFVEQPLRNLGALITQAKQFIFNMTNEKDDNNINELKEALQRNKNLFIVVS